MQTLALYFRGDRLGGPFVRGGGTRSRPLAQERGSCSRRAPLLPLAKVLAEEIHAVAGLDLPTASGRPGPGDIGLALDPALSKESYKLVVGERAAVSGGNYGAVARERSRSFRP